ncbi:MAG: MoaD/ThiS family protein [Planctomycetes bacterium]|nr:MoaD/ThiS family protein [Planctomycetota bacterium]
MIVHLPGLLDRYTQGEREQEVAGPSLDAAFRELDERFPGIRFRLIDEQERVRPHIRIYVGPEPIEDLAQLVPDGQAVHVIGALSGG